MLYSNLSCINRQSILKKFIRYIFFIGIIISFALSAGAENKIFPLKNKATATNQIVSQKETVNQGILLDSVQRRQKTITYIILGALVIVIILGGLTLLSLQEKQIANVDLQDKNEEILQQRNQIQEMAEKAEEATQAKLKFFTNISHEFRTPLTLILGPTEEWLAKNSGVNKELRNDLLLIQSNANRLLRLVNQLLDFRKIENGSMELRATQNELISFVKSLSKSFERLAKSRNIQFEVFSNVDSLNCWFDVDKLDKVIFNLLSNAFKFTADNGKISIRIINESVDNCVRIIVEDNGRGMNPSDLDRIFDRFFQVDNFSDVGSGLGLALSKELILLHKGDIKVQSEKWKGTRFDVTLPFGNEHLTLNQLAEKQAEHFFVNDDLPYEITPNEKAKETVSGKKFSLLLIEDNTEVRSFLRSRLSDEYELWEELNGNLGLSKAFEVVPDLIICDVMLPGKDGFDITQKLKSDFRTSHIPVILLTALSSIEKQIEGTQMGADAYFCKPFNMALLRERIKTLLRNRQILRERYISEIDKVVYDTSENTLDKKFVNDFVAMMESNFHKSDFQVNDMCKEMGVSRVQLYRKVKALLNCSVNDYLQDVRLKKARYLLRQTNEPIQDIALKVGFTSQGYFASSFKAKFQITPTEYRNNMPTQPL
ncbi:hybrid sensor histidine kinase/response regulator transcription factor [Arcicella rigui]|uniref:histidine kinase n=1 Tax=Arcicella rigui TaxID=797020 RepID=A0ABU5Q570_9BACT|nr:ATP-binding protein [Arcicella rigui]MEA5137990.1 ATP-binding protein [Arcicella rigui]